jgi:solute carrier family 13 (sodium-dependent dicarboxylate transporter), member 2/3/5
MGTNRPQTATPETLEAGSAFRPLPILLAAVAAFAVALAPIPGLSPRAHQTLVILVVAGGLWMSEALPVAVTALLIPILGIALGVTDARGAFSGFGDPIVFLFFGTFLLTDAAAQHGLTARLAHRVLGSEMVRRKPTRLLWAIAFLGCGISAWMNNTATTALLLPLALTAERYGSRRLLVGILLMSAYAPSLGGLATPVGTAPNLIGLRLLEQATGQRPSFTQWCVTFAPLAVLSTVLTALWLRRGTGDAKAVAVAAAPREPTPWSLAERTLMPLFGVVILLWILPGILAGTPLQGAAWLKAWQARLPEPAVPMLGALALFLLPSGAPGGARILDIPVLKRVDWSTLLLFGGGLSLGAMMFDSGLARALGEGIFRAMPIGGTFGIVLAATLMAVIVSEMTSNTASASLVVPVVLALAQAAGVDPVKPALAATVACSFGFMLPVSTPPNALVFATGKLRIREMVAYGALLDLGGVALVAAWVTLFG